MSQQAQNDYYKRDEDAAMDYAVAVNAEIKDLFAAGADYVQIDEPYMQARPEKAEAFGLAALNRALEGVAGETIVHICFGYAAIIHQRPSGYSFLGQLKGCSCKQVSLETAQSKLDCSALSDLKGKKILLGVLDLADMTVETAEVVAARIRRALPYASPEDIVVAPDCGLNISAPSGGRQDAGHGRRRRDLEARARSLSRIAGGLRPRPHVAQSGKTTPICNSRLAYSRCSAVAMINATFVSLPASKKAKRSSFLSGRGTRPHSGFAENRPRSKVPCRERTVRTSPAP